ncbi:MAG TPA: AraC family transcriptional regulator, partial [Burkholderiales bacterium]|nr:AraC family transcriptional regulator [Burkholderiales bacterium]
RNARHNGFRKLVMLPASPDRINRATLARQRRHWINIAIHMRRTIKTYTLSERVASADFGIHDERGTARIEHAHRHEYFQIQLNLAGQTEHTIGAAMHALEPGSLSFVLPYRVHRARRPPGSRFYVINFGQRFLRPELEVDALDLEDVPLERAPELAPFLFQEFMDFRLDGAEFKLARQACRKMIDENSRRRFCSIEMIRANLMLLIGTVCRRYERNLLKLAAAQAQRKSRRNALSGVIRYVRGNLAQRITLPDAAAAAHLSPNYLAHLLKKETGKTFTDLVTERRMEKARELLAHTTMRISEIAEAVGFGDEAYFARRFRQCFEIAPRDYRAQASARLR